MTSRTPALLVLAIVLATAAAAAIVPSETSNSSRSLILVLDASGSMWGQIDGENKIVIARRVLGDLVAELPDGISAALIAYGHRREGDCADVETVVPLAGLDRGRLVSAVERLDPKGKTPIAAALQQAIDLAESAQGPATVILVSDGLETCQGDPCTIVRTAREAGVDLVLHVVGFGIEDGDVSQLECAAQAGGGLYSGVEDAAELARALGRAVEPPLDNPATLAVGAAVSGDPVDAMVRVTRGGEDVAAGRTYTGPDTNPRVFALPAGVYDVEVAPVRIEGAASAHFSGVRIEAGGREERIADFSSGELAVLVTRNGALSDATVTVYRAGTREQAAAGRTYTSESSNPKVFTLSAGTWDVEIKSVEISGGPGHGWHGVTVTGGERTERAYAFASGALRVGATSNGELVDATVSIEPAAGGPQVAGGRTYTSEKTNPKSFVLSPGSYRAKVRPVRLPGAEPRTLAVEVVAGETIERIVDFDVE